MKQIKVKKSEQEWKESLSPEQFRILREKGTERAFTGEYWNNHDQGMYRCAACGEPLFDAHTKFDSGTGWPSFFTSIPGAFEQKKDFLLIFPRTDRKSTRLNSSH